MSRNCKNVRCGVPKCCVFKNIIIYAKPKSVPRSNSAIYIFPFLNPLIVVFCDTYLSESANYNKY